MKSENEQHFQRICVVGLGYIGLPTAAMFASRRRKVIGVDINRLAVDTINRGEIHIVEPELDILVRAAVKEGWLRATTRPEPADAFLIAVPTPFKGRHTPDLDYVQAAARSIAPVLKKGDLVILESTSPVGTTERVAQWLAEERPDLRFPHHHAADPDINVAYCPERVLPGHVVRELVENDRVIGGMTPRCAQRACEVYRIFVEGDLHVTDSRTAEMTKLVENAFRDVNIAFANELSLICDKLDINVWELVRLANRHPRVNILQPGAGVGGHCIAVDPWFIVDSAPEEARLIRTAREVNNAKPDWVIAEVSRAIERIRHANPGLCESDIKIAVLGLAFKPNTDDLRESPALHIARRLARHRAVGLRLVEPHISALPDGLAEHSLSGLRDAVADAHIVLVLVAHGEFGGLKEMLSPGQIVLDAVGATHR